MTASQVELIQQRALELRCRPNLPDAEERRRRRLYELGLSDPDIGGLLGLSRRTIGMWRAYRDLPRNHPLGGDRLSREFRHARRERLRIAARVLEEVGAP